MADWIRIAFGVVGQVGVRMCGVDGSAHCPMVRGNLAVNMGWPILYQWGIWVVQECAKWSSCHLWWSVGWGRELVTISGCHLLGLLASVRG